MALEGTEDIVLHQYKNKWIAEQIELRQKLKIENRHAWILPPDLSQIIADDKDSNIGIIRKLSNEETKSSENERKNNNHENDSKKNNDNNQGKGKGNGKGKGKGKPKNKRVLRIVAGVDISPAKSYTFDPDKAVASLVICEYPSMRILHNEKELVRLTQPYIAGFLAFREVSHLVRLIDNVKKNKPQIIPDVIIVDGNGILHHRGFGLASHLGVLVNIPTIGVAKKLLKVQGINNDYEMNKVNYPYNFTSSEPLLSKYMTKKGGFYKITGYEYNYKKDHYKPYIIGAALKTCTSKHDSNCIYVSIGHRVSLMIALRIVVDCLKNTNRLPYPVHEAAKQSRIDIRDYEKNYQNPYAHNLHQNTREYNEVNYNYNYNNNNRNNYERGNQGRNGNANKQTNANAPGNGNIGQGGNNYNGNNNSNSKSKKRRNRNRNNKNPNNGNNNVNRDQKKNEWPALGS